MSQSISPVSIPGDCEIVSTYLKKNLEIAGYQVIRSFDLQRARGAHTECACPHHGKAQCDCQMIVFLIYLANGEPYTLLIHGGDGSTQFSWDESLPGSEERFLCSIIKDVFSQIKSTQKSDIPLSN